MTEMLAAFVRARAPLTDDCVVPPVGRFGPRPDVTTTVTVLARMPRDRSSSPLVLDLRETCLIGLRLTTGELPRPTWGRQPDGR